jgi:hypothetical protein
MSATRDGSLTSLELKGDLELRITDPAFTKLAIQISPSSVTSLLPTSALQFKTHPHVDKAGWADSRQVRLRDVKKPFPVRQNLGVLRWRGTTKDETSVPLSVQCWPSPVEDGSGACDVMIEFELEATQLSLQNVVISIPLPAGVEPSVEAPENGITEILDDSIEWHIEEISEESGVTSGQLEIKVHEGAQDIDVFFPVSIDFISQKTMGDISVSGEMIRDSETSLSNNFSILLFPRCNLLRPSRTLLLSPFRLNRS